jgi:hypothetical protein
MQQSHDDLIIDIEEGKVNELALLPYGIKNMPTMHAEEMFRIGTKLLSEDSTLSKNGVVALTGLNRGDIDKAKIIAKFYDCDMEKFKEAFVTSKKITWQEFCRVHIKRQRLQHREIKDEDMIHLASEVKRALGRFVTEKAEGMTKYFNEIRKMITRVIPPAESIADKNYLRYYQCCCCGAEPDSPDGHHIGTLKSERFVHFPVCDTCKELHIRPDWERIARMYANYAINLEHYLDKL